MFLFLFACKAPELVIRHLDNITSEITQDGRFLLDSPTITVTLHNEGNDTLELERMIHSEKIVSDLELPLLLEPEQSQELQLQYIPSLDGEYVNIIFQGNIVEQKLKLQGDISPYIQLDIAAIVEMSETFAQEFEAQEVVGAAIGMRKRLILFG